MLRSMGREQIERAERVAQQAERERKQRRDRREDEIAGVVTLAEVQGWKKPASLATGKTVKARRVEPTFTDKQLEIAMRSLERHGA